MKKNLLSLAAIAAMSLLPLQAQVRTVNSASNVSVSSSPAFIDASSNTTVNGSSNIGKGLIFPRVNLSAMTSFPGVTAGIPNSFPTRFDGMIVYNTATSGTAGVGSTSGTLSPGYWYYENKTSSNTGGTWKSLGSIAAAAIEPWNNAATGTGATANTQDVYQMGKVGIGTATPTSTLHTNGSFATRYTAVGANTSLDITHHTVNAVHNSGTVTLTLPPVSGITGRQYVVQNNGYGTTNVVVSGGGTIEGQTTFTMNQVGQTAQLIAGNSEWQLVTNAIKSASVPSGANIYTANGTLSSNRIVNVNNNTLNFTGSGIVNIEPTLMSSNIVPAIDASYTLGTNGSRYNFLYGNSADFTAGVNVGGQLTTSGVLPRIDNTYPMGSTSNRWSTIFGVGGDFSAGVNIGGQLTTANIVPITDASYTLGTNGSRYNFLYGNSADFTSGVNVGGQLTTSGVVPRTNNSYPLGGASNRWSTIFGVGGDFSAGVNIGGQLTTANIVPITDASYTLGTNGSRYNFLYGNSADFTSGVNVGGQLTTSGVVPRTNNSYPLGGASNRWSTIFGVGGDFSAGVNIGGQLTTANIVPVTDASYTLGTNGLRYSFLYGNSADFSAGVNVGGQLTTSGVVPQANNSYPLGGASNRWSTIFGVGGDFSAGVNIGGQLNVTGISYASSHINTSDKRLKSNIDNIRYGIAAIMELQPKQFDLAVNHSIKNSIPVSMLETKHSIGFLAQDLYNVIPEAAYRPGDQENEAWGVDYGLIVPVLTKAIQEQQEQIEILKKEVKALQEKSTK